MSTATNPGFRFHDLHGKSLLITGITRGIGRALLPGLLEQGLNLVLVSRGRETMEAVRESLGADESRVRLFVCDLGDPAAVAATAESIARSVPQLDGILHNAAIDPRQTFERCDEAFWQQVFQVNLFASITLTRHLLPLLRRSPQGRVLFTGSVTGGLGSAYMSAYVASKGAIEALTRSLAHELKGTDITVNCVVPGAVRVPEDAPNPELEATVISTQCVPRRLAPDDLLGLICLLLSRAGGGITAQNITVDGGMLHHLADPAFQSAFIKE